MNKFNIGERNVDVNTKTNVLVSQTFEILTLLFIKFIYIIVKSYFLSSCLCEQIQNQKPSNRFPL